MVAPLPVGLEDFGMGQVHHHQVVARPQPVRSVRQRPGSEDARCDSTLY
jgi:hypothetical protein